MRTERSTYSDITDYSESRYGPAKKGVDQFAQITQLTPGRLEVRNQLLTIPQISISDISVNRSMSLNYRTAPGTVLCRIPLGSAVAGNCWSGTEMPSHALGFHRPDHDYSVAIPSGWHVLKLHLSCDLLDSFGLVTAPKPPCKWQQGVIIPMQGGRHASLVQEILALLANYTEISLTESSGLCSSCGCTAVNCHCSDNALVATQFRDSLMTTLASVINKAAGEERVTRVRLIRRYSMVQAAKDFIEENLSRPIGLVEIAAAVNSSPRVVQYGFRDVLHVSPYQYLQYRRLCVIKRQLPTMTETPLVSLAEQFGFRHYGRFTQQYRKMFGEAPSDTRRITKSLGFARMPSQD